MTKKRFTMCHEQNDLNGWTMSIVDWQTKQPFDYTTYEVHSSSITDTKDEMEDLCLLLNEQHEKIQQQKEAIEHLSYDCEYLNNNFEDKCKENEQLKIQLQNISDQRDEFHRGARENANRVGKLKKENEQLKVFNHDLSENLSVCADKRLAQGEHLTELKQENEQLKQQIDNMAFILRQNGLGLMEDDE